jgi:hypothetical protein
MLSAKLLSSTFLLLYSSIGLVLVMDTSFLETTRL